MRPAALAVVLVFIALAPGFATAQSPSDVALARELFEQAVGHAQARQWEDAAEAFERSYALSPRAGTLINLAGAQQQTGRLVAARESYRSFLQEDDQPPELREEAEQNLAQLEQRIARLNLTVRNLRPDDVVELDGIPVREASLGVGMPIDPGSHRVVATRSGGIREERSFEAGDGEETSIELVLPVPREDAGSLSAGPRLRSPGEDPGDDDGDSVFASPWFWIVTGALAIGAGLAAVFLLVDFDEDPFVGNATPGMIGVP